MKRVLVVAATLLLGVGAVVAQQDVVKQTQTVMKGNGKNAGALAAIVKGEKPYDQATVDTAMAQFEDTAKKLRRSGKTRRALMPRSRAFPRS